MKGKNVFWAVVEAGLWYLTAAFFFYSIQNAVDIWLSALGVIVLGYLAAWACPLLRNTDAWKRTYGQG